MDRPTQIQLLSQLQKVLNSLVKRTKLTIFRNSKSMWNKKIAYAVAVKAQKSDFASQFTHTGLHFVQLMSSFDDSSQIFLQCPNVAIDIFDKRQLEFIINVWSSIPMFRLLCAFVHSYIMCGISSDYIRFIFMTTNGRWALELFQIHWKKNNSSIIQLLIHSLLIQLILTCCPSWRTFDTFWKFGGWNWFESWGQIILDKLELVSRYFVLQLIKLRKRHREMGHVLVVTNTLVLLRWTFPFSHNFRHRLFCYVFVGSLVSGSGFVAAISANVASNIGSCEI